MLGTRLKKLRLEHNLTQKQFAELFKLSERQYQNYEINKSKPTLDGIISICNYFDVSLDYLIGRTNDSNSNVSNEISDANDTIEILVREYKLDDFSKTAIKEFIALNSQEKNTLKKFLRAITSFEDEYLESDNTKELEDKLKSYKFEELSIEPSTK